MGAMKETRSVYEEIARQFLERKGYCVLERNLDVGDESIDFVLRDEDGDLVFLEVLGGDDDRPYLPNERSARPTREAFERAAARYLESHQPGNCRVRFDLISLLLIGGDRALLKHHMDAYSTE